MEAASASTRKGKFFIGGGIISSPIFRATMAQLVALCLSYLLYVADKRQFSGTLTPLILLVFHATSSVLISMLLRLSWWWWLIQFIFPFAVVASLVFHLSPGLSFGIFLVMVLLFWTTYRTQVPYFPSRSGLLPYIIEQLPTKDALRFIDVGSGCGGVSLHLAKARPRQLFYGVEVAPFPWIVSWIRAQISAKNVKFYLRDYCQLDFAKYDVVFVYLSPAAMPGLWKKAEEEMRPGTLLMSYEFVVPGVEADLTIKSISNGPALYIWRI